MMSNAFNTKSKRPRTNWSLENGYIDTNIVDSYPYRTSGSGQHFSLQIILKIFNDDIEHLCNAGSDGLFVMFTRPGNSFQKWDNYYRIPLGRTTTFTINPHLTTTASNIHSYQPHVRGCYLNSERSLQFFKQYSRRNCEVECLTNYTLAQCGCVKFSMPRKNKKKKLIQFHQFMY